MIKENLNSNEVKLLLLLSKLRHLNRCNWTHRVLVSSLDYRKYFIFSICYQELQLNLMYSQFCNYHLS